MKTFGFDAPMAPGLATTRRTTRSGTATHSQGASARAMAHLANWQWTHLDDSLCRPETLTEMGFSPAMGAPHSWGEALGEFFGFIWCAIAGLFRSRAALQAEIQVLRHQLNILHRRSPKRVALGKIDRLVFCGLYRLSPTVLDVLKILQPETVIRWYRAGFRAYWR